MRSLFLFPQFRFLQIVDPDAGNTPSFLAYHMEVRYSCMLDDIGFIKSRGWKTHSKFEEYVSSLNGLDDNDKKNRTANALTSYGMSGSH